MDVLNNQADGCCSNDNSINIENQQLHDKIREQARLNAEELIHILMMKSQGNGIGQAKLLVDDG